MNMRRVLPAAFIVCFAMHQGFAQCDCKTLEQNNGQIYKKCSPFIRAEDSTGKLELSISKLQTSWLLYGTLTVADIKQQITGKLTITTSVGNVLYALMVDHAPLYIDGIPMFTSSFVTTDENLRIMQQEKIAAIQYTLNDGTTHLITEMEWLNDILQQMNCIK